MATAESLAADLAIALDRIGIRFMLVGAAALAVRGVTRGSHDIDFMTTDRHALAQSWEDLIPGPVHCAVLRGDADDPLEGTVRFSREDASPVDLVVAKWKWQQEVLDRSERIDLGWFTAPVPRVEDLVLLKLEAGSYLDERDAAQLIEVNGAGVIEAVKQRIADLPEPLQEAWRRFLRSIDPRE